MFDFLLASKLTPGNWENLKIALTILWQGLPAIFVVIAIIIGIVYLVNFFTAKAAQAKKKREEAAKSADSDDVTER